MAFLNDDSGRLSPEFDVYRSVLEQMADEKMAATGIPTAPLPPSTEQAIPALSRPNIPEPFNPPPIQLRRQRPVAAPAEAPMGVDTVAMRLAPLMQGLADKRAASLGLISVDEPIRPLPYKMEGVPATANLPVESIGPTQGIVPQSDITYQTRRRLASENAAIDADRLRAYLGNPSRQEVAEQARQKAARTPGDVISDIAGQFTMNYINMAGWGLPGIIVKAVGGEPILGAKTGAGEIAGGIGSLLGLMGKVPAHVVRFLAEKKIGAEAVQTILSRGMGKQAEEAALRESEYAATSMGRGTGIRAARAAGEASDLVGAAKVGVVSKTGALGKAGQFFTEGDIGGQLGTVLDEVAAEMPGAIKGIGGFAPFHVAGKAIDVATNAISKLVGFEAKSLPGKIFKNTIVNAATLGTAMGAVSWEGGEPWEVLKNKLKAAGEGALMGAIFGVADFVPFAKQFPVMARIVRFGGTTAILDSMEGKNPLDGRSLFKKVVDYGLNAMFTWNGADKKGLLRDLPAEAKAFNEGLKGIDPKLNPPIMPDSVDKIAQLIVHQDFVTTAGGVTRPSNVAETKVGAQTLNEQVLREQGVASEIYNKPPEAGPKQINAEARQGMIDTLTEELKNPGLEPERRAEYQSALDSVKGTQVAPEPWPRETPKPPVAEGTGVSIPGAESHVVTIKPQADGSIQIIMPKPQPAAAVAEPAVTEAPAKGRVYKNDETGFYKGKDGNELVMSRDKFDSDYIPARKGKGRAAVAPVTATEVPQKPIPEPIVAPTSPPAEVQATPLPEKIVAAPVPAPVPVKVEVAKPPATVAGPDIKSPKVGDVFQHKSGATEKVASFDGSLVKMENGRQVGINAFKTIYSVPPAAATPPKVDLSGFSGAVKRNSDGKVEVSSPGIETHPSEDLMVPAVATPVEEAAPRERAAAFTEPETAQLAAVKKEMDAGFLKGAKADKISITPDEADAYAKAGGDISKFPNVVIELEPPEPVVKKTKEILKEAGIEPVVEPEVKPVPSLEAQAKEPGLVDAREARRELQAIKDSMPTFSEDVEVLPPGDVSMTKAEKAAKEAQDARIAAGELNPLPKAHKIKRPKYEEPAAEPAPRDVEADRKAINDLANNQKDVFKEITAKLNRMADPGKSARIWEELIDGKFDPRRGLTISQWIDARARDLGAGGEHIDGIKKDLNRVRFNASKTNITPEDVAQDTIGGGNIEGRKTPEQLYEEKQLEEREGGAWQKFVDAGVKGSKKPERDREILDQRVSDGATLQRILDSPEGADLNSIQAVRAVILRTLNRGMADPEAVESLKTNAKKIFDRLMAEIKNPNKEGWVGERRIDKDGYRLKEDRFGNWVRDPSKPAPLPKTWKTDVERDFLNILDRANVWCKTYLTSTRGMSPVLAQFNDLRYNAARAVMFHAGQDMAGLNKLLKDMPDGWAKDEATKHVMDFLAGKYDSNSVEQFPQEYRDLLTTMRGRIDDLTKLFVATGAPTKNLRETMMKNLGTYLPEQYQIYNNKDYKADTVAMEALRKRLIKEFPDEYKSYTPDMWGNYFEGMIREAREIKKGPWGSGGDEEISIEKRHLKHKNEEKWQEWKDFAKPVGDWRWMYKYTMTHLGEMAYNAQFLDTLIKTHPDMVADTQAEALKRWGNERDWKPDTKLDNSARWGAMKGKWVSPQLKRFIEGEMDQTSKFMHNAAMEFMNRYITSPFKWTRTVGSVPSIMRNLLGAGAQSSLGGAFLLNPWNFKYYKESNNILTHRNGLRREEFAELVKAGITEVQYVGNEIPKFSEYLMKKNPVEWGELADNVAKSSAAERMVKGAGAGYSGVRYSIGKAGDFMGQLYNYGDQIYRVAAHLKNIKEYKMTPFESAMEINMAFQNYKMLPIAVDWLRKFPVFGPFVSFKMNTLKIMSNQIMRAAHEIDWGAGKTDINPYHAEFASAPESKRSEWSNASRQEVLARGIKRAFKVSAYISLPSIVSQVSQHMAGITNEERKAYEDALPAYRKGNLLIYFRDKGGNITSFDPTFVVPGLDFPIKQMNILHDAIFNNHKEKLSTMMGSMNIGESPLFDMYNLMMYGMDPSTHKTGREDVFPWREETSRIGKALGYLLVPGTYGAVKKIAQAVGGEVDPYTKKPLSIPGAVINLATGLKTFEVNIGREVSKNIAAMQKEGMAIAHDYQNGKISKEKWQRQILYLKEQITKAKVALGQVYKQKQ